MDRNGKIVKRIRTHIDRLLNFAAGKSYEDFCTNYMLYDAIVMNLLQIGEQARNLDNDFCK